MVGPQVATRVLSMACLLSETTVCRAALRETWAAAASHSLCPGNQDGEGLRASVQTRRRGAEGFSPLLGQATNLSTPSISLLMDG